MNHPKVSIIILNWNGLKDTIECLENVFRIDYPNYQVIIVDNGSTDGSVEKIKAWAEGRLLAEPQSHDERITRLVTPPVAKPIPYAEYSRTEAEKGGFTVKEQARLILI